jgi:hypothetical protein
MKKNIIKAQLILFVIFTFEYCSFTQQLTVPSTIPADMQQLIKSTKVDGVNYSFTSNPKAEICEFQFTYGGAIIKRQININTALKPLFDELFQTKFSKIDDKSQNKVSVKILDLISNNDEPTIINLTMEIEVMHQNKINKKELGYSVSLPYESNQQSNVLHSFLMKFIIGTDKFLDNEFDVQ